MANVVLPVGFHLGSFDPFDSESMPSWLISSVTQGPPCDLLLSLSRECNPASMIHSLYICYSQSRNLTSHPLDVIVLAIRGHSPKKKKKSKFSFSSMSHPWSGQPSSKSHPNCEQTLLFCLKEALEGRVTAVGKEVCIWTRTAWVCSTPVLSLTVGHARASPSLPYAPPSALRRQSVTSALQRGCQQCVQT